MTSSTSSSSYVHANGHEGPIAGTSKATNGYSQEPADPHSQSTPTAAQAHADRVVSHLYESGFQRGNYSDTTVHVGSAIYRLHAIILSKSPYLVHLMSTSVYNNNTIYIPLEQYPDVTLEAMAIALGWLYSYDALSMLNPTNARATLASACLLGNMDDLCSHAFRVCKESIGLETIESWLGWVDSLVARSTTTSPNGSPLATPRSPSPNSLGTRELPLAQSIFGPYAQLLREEVFEFLVVGLPQVLHAAAEEASSQNPLQDTYEQLLRIYSGVSFDIFKSAMESPKFEFLSSDQERFRFAKAAIVRRKQGAGREAEESVVLAVGDGRSNVHVTRKLRRKSRPLWKVTK